MRTKLIVVATVVMLIITVLLLLYLHSTNEKEVVRRYQAEQLVASRQLAKEIESYLHDRALGINIISSFQSLQNRDMKKTATDIQSFFDYVKKDHIKAVSVYDERGNIIYSTAKDLIGRNYGNLDYFQWASKKENKGKQFVSSLIRKTDDQRAQLPYYRFLIATPIYCEGISTGKEFKNTLSQKSNSKFIGILTATIDLEEIISSFLPLVSAYTNREHAYILDKNGTLLFHSEHPGMVLRNIHSFDKTCFQCHVSLDHVKTILSEKEGTFEYALKERRKDLAGFSSLEFNNISWKIVICISYDEVSGFINKSLYMTLILIGIITLTLIGGSSLIFRSNRLKIIAQEEAKQWKEKRELENKIRESEEHYRTVVDISSDAIIIHCEGEIVFVNPAAIKLFNASSANELLGKPAIEFVHPDERESIMKRVLEILTNNNTPQWLEERFITVDGRIIYLDTIGTLTTYNGKAAVQVILHDNTERKLAEETLRTSEEKYRHLVENLGKEYFFYRHDKDGVFTYVSNSMTEMLGYSKQEFLTHHTEHHTDNPINNEVVKHTELSIQGQQQAPYELETYHKDRSKVWLEVTEIPLRDHNGKIYAIEGIAKDITGRKLAEKALRDSEEKYRKLVELTPDALLIHIDGIIQYVNSASVKLFDAGSKANLIGKKVIDFVHPDYRKIVRQRIGKIIDENVEVPTIEEKLITLKGIAFDAEVTAIPISLMGRNGVQVIARDITERKHAEEELKNAESLLHTVLENAPITIFATDSHGIFTLSEGKGLERVGLKPGENVGVSAIDLFSSFPFFKETGEVITGKDVIHRTIAGESMNVFSELSGVIFDNRMSPIHDDKGAVVGIVGVATDITERKKAEEELLNVHDQLLEAQRITHSGSWEADFISGKLIWSDEMYRIYGVDRESFGHTREALLELIHPDDRHILLDSFQNIFSGKQNILSHQLRIIHPDGSIHFVESSNKAYFDSNGKPVRVIGATQDITDRKLVEIEREQYFSFFQTSSDLMCIADPNGNFKKINPIFSQLLGYSETELLAKPFIEFVHPDDKQATLDEMAMQQQKGFSLNFENRYNCKDGSVRWLSWRAKYDKDEAVTYATARDITERKKSEEEINESKNQLEKLYKRLNDIRENERAEISREIHDELGQSLTALKMDLNWTKANLTDKMLVAKKFNSMIDIVSGTIKKVQRISAALRPGMLDDLGLIPAVQWYGQEFEERSGLKCNFDLKELPAHNSQINLTLFRIFQEGLTNIVRHANAKSVDVKLYSSSDNIILKITDDGIGTEQEKIDSKESLGLLGMKERIKQFNGSLEIISSENKGTSLIVSIPIIN